jgi:Tfp pilus assembly protein PilZ
MENYSLKDEIIKNIGERQGARKKFNATQPLIAACRTRGAKFEAFIQNVSSSGVFIKTTKNLLAGQEIAMTFTFPKTQKTIMATGEIVRISYDGAGVKFKIFFKV